jgi:hypothetical protein
MAFSDAAIFLAQSTDTTGAGTTIDVSGFLFGPAVIIIISATATVQIQQSFDRVNWITAVTISSSDAYVLEPRGLYYRTNVTANTGTVTASVGPGILQDGAFCGVRSNTTKSGGPS